MENLLKYSSQIKNFINKYKVYILFFLAFTFLMLSFVAVPKEGALDRGVKKLQSQIHKRQILLDEYVQRALDIPQNEWLTFEDFPDDFVIYRYNADTLQSWINQFPISNDEVDALTLWHRMEPFKNRTMYNSPLAYLEEGDQYVNLGSAWYIVRVYKDGQTKIISGLLVKTDYLSNNSVLKNKVNPHLKLSRRMTITPISYDNGYVVESINGDVLFSVVDDVSKLNIKSTNPFIWIFLFFTCWALYLLLLRNRNKWMFIIYFLGLSGIRYICFILAKELRYTTELFSSNLYADKGIFSSLGNFLLNNLYVFLIVLGIFLLRRNIIKSLQRIVSIPLKIVALIIVLSFPIALFCYINYTFNSLIINSSIALELYRLEELSIYSILAYISYGLLFIAVLLLLQIILNGFKIVKKNSLFSVKNILIYVLIVSLYTLFVVTDKSYIKENEMTKVWSNKLSVERDIAFELDLRMVESKLVIDPIINILISMPHYNTREDLIRERINEAYLRGINQKYDVNITICKPKDVLLLKQNMVDCSEAYREKLLNAIPLSNNSNFFFINNFNGKVCYLGIFKFGNITMYIEFESIYSKDIIGYSALLFDYKSSDNVNLPRKYSYAKYLENKLVLYRGNYNYPMGIDTANYKKGYSSVVKDNYVHFVNKIDDSNLIFISRPKRSIYPCIVSFSYLMLFYSGLLFSFVKLRKLGRSNIKLKFPKKSFRRKITYLLIISLVVSLICMGLGSVWFCINYYNETNRLQMEEKLNNIHSNLTEVCKYAYSFTDINTPTVFQTVDRMANSNKVDINLFDPYGRLIRSTQNELFNRFLLASRINPKAYEDIVYKKKKQVVNKEQLSELSYYSLYAPIFNAQGNLIAIVNIPYFFKDAGLTSDISTILATIINVYILLILASILGSAAVSNQLSKPLAILSKKMQYLDVYKKAEHIDYRNDDELGTLVNAYNKMVDDLEESSYRLAQTEREKAWSEMARQIAHEIKNPLTPMRLSIQHLIRLKQRNAEGWENKFEEIAGSILEQIDILSNTASEFSSFAKFYYEESSVLNLYQLVSEQKILFDTRDNIRIAFYYCSDICNVFARKGQIIRVIVNLLTNAIQAVENSGRGYITISLKEDENIYLVSFEDNGCGVKLEDEGKLFKPNFTTKSGGTGLGLAISKNIIEQSGGKIFYTKSEFGGAAFTFTLPKYTNKFTD